MNQKRPLGVTLISIYSLFFALVSLPVGCVGMAAVGAPGSGVWVGLLALLTIAYGVFSFASAYGLWTFQSWGRRLSLWLYGAGIVLGVIAMFPLLPGQQFSMGNLVFELVGIAVSLVIIGYLAGERVKVLFNETPSARGAAQAVRQEPRF